MNSTVLIMSKRVQNERYASQNTAFLSVSSAETEVF